MQNIERMVKELRPNSFTVYIITYFCANVNTFGV